MSNRDWAIPGAIVAAGAIVGLGAYLGLRHQPAADARAPAMATPAPSSPAATTPSSKAPSSAAPSGATPKPPEPKIDVTALRKQTETAALAAIETKRADMVKQCWDPVASLPEHASKPDHVKIGFSLAYRKDGTLAGSGVIEDRETTRDGMHECLAPIAHSLTIPPPGSNISVEVNFQLP